MTKTDRAEGDLARRIAHAIRSPLSIVRTAMTADAPVQQELRARMQALAERAVDQLEGIADRLTLLGRLDAGLTPSPRATDLRDVAAAAVRAVERTRQRRGVTTRLTTPSDAVPANVDAELLERAWAELIDNAVRFARAEVTVDLRATDDGAKLLVENDGPPCERKLFEAALDRSAPLSDRTGLGVGLWMANTIARLHAGTLECEVTGADAGVALTMTIPRGD